MKCIFLIALFVFSAQEVLTYSASTVPCIARLCSTEHAPVCGKQFSRDCWDVQIFNNSCLMESANDCGKANWVPCVEDRCIAVA